MPRGQQVSAETFRTSNAHDPRRSLPAIRPGSGVVAGVAVLTLDEGASADHAPDQAALPTTLRLKVRGLGDVLFCHATPRDDEEVVLVDSDVERWAEVFADVDPAVTTIVCGHTHMPFTRLAAGRLVVNPGSVGMPYGRAGAHWALLGPGVQLRRTLLDVEAAAARIAADSAFEQAAEWADYCLNARATEEDAFAIFVPHEGRGC